jgi:SAM-dependent methyltransferase
MSWYLAALLLLLLPVGLGFLSLAFSSRLRSSFFAWVWLSFGEKGTDLALRSRKKRFVSEVSITGAVLDVGTGGGIQLPYIVGPEVTRVVCVEPNKRFLRSLRRQVSAIEHTTNTERNVNGLPPVTIFVFSGTIDDYLKSNSEEKFDVVTCFLVLCSIPQPLACLTLLHDHCLKPGGRLLFIEHVAPSPGDP